MNIYGNSNYNCLLNLLNITYIYVCNDLFKKMLKKEST